MTQENSESPPIAASTGPACWADADGGWHSAFRSIRDALATGCSVRFTQGYLGESGVNVIVELNGVESRSFISDRVIGEMLVPGSLVANEVSAKAFAVHHGM